MTQHFFHVLIWIVNPFCLPPPKMQFMFYPFIWKLDTEHRISEEKENIS